MALKGSLSESKASSLLSHLVPTQSLQDLKKSALVVEAVVENVIIKKKLFTTLGQAKPSTCLLVSNTSTLDMDQMASVLSSKHQKMYAGWHFFSPAHVMKLVEIVVAKETSPETVALLQVLTKKIGKIGVTVGNCDGFVGNRMLNPYTSECVLLLAEGDATVESVDEAIRDFGMALGPFGMSDLAGNDIG
jgi:3-hydroxyacyl-CoA dehydrogenase